VLYGACTTLAILRCLYMTLGNPGGRPKVLGEIQELARQLLHLAENPGTIAGIAERHAQAAQDGQRRACPVKD